MTVITHRCNQVHGKRQLPCTAFRTDDGFLHHTCGEPCSWIMGKGGHGEPPFVDRENFDPTKSDLDNTEVYMHKYGITTIAVTKKEDSDGNPNPT